VSNIEIEQTFAQLDHREKNGYTRLTLDLNLGSDAVLTDEKVIAGITYIADEYNEAYLGQAPIAQIAKEIFHSVGPSGTNTEYLLKLAQALRDRVIDDPHVFAVETEIRTLLNQSS
jgi:cation transport regulator ChaC